MNSAESNIKSLPIQYVSLREGIEKNTKIYPFNIPLIKNFKKISFKMPVTFIIGENGTGKSTFLEAIAVAFGFNAEGGSINFNFKTKETHSMFYKFIKIAKSYNFVKDGYFLRGESFYNLATNIDELDSESYKRRLSDSYGGKSLHEQSHGEGFLSLLSNRLGGNGFYIFDEPETALSPMKILNLLVLMLSCLLNFEIVSSQGTLKSIL